MSRLAQRSLQRAEEVVYLGVGLLLLASALLVLGNAVYHLVTDVDEGCGRRSRRCSTPSW